MTPAARASFSPKRAFVGGWPGKATLLSSQYPSQRHQASLPEALSVLAPHICTAHKAIELRREQSRGILASVRPPVCVVSSAHSVTYSFQSLCALRIQLGMRSCPYGTYNPAGAAQIKWKTVCFCLSLSMEGEQEKLRHMTIALKDWPLS